MALQLIDFNAKFMEDYLKWASENPDIANDEDRMEDELFYDMYLKWMQTPKPWLENQSPNQYFEGIEDPRMYVSAMIEYIVEEVSLPDPLVEQILLHKEAVYPILLGILEETDGVAGDESEEALAQIKANCVLLITQMQMPHPYKKYISLLLAQEEEDALLTEVLAEVLSEVGLDYLEELIHAYARAEGYARKALVDILAGFIGQESVYRILAAELLEEDADIAFIAVCMGRFGDERAAAMLKEISTLADIDVYTFMAIQAAVEQITGEIIEPRAFDEEALGAYIVNIENEQ